MSQLYVFDLDGTLVINPRFYQQMYSGSLEQLIRREAGDHGLKTLQFFRSERHGRGELALPALNIPFEAWASALCRIDTSSILPEPETVFAVRSLPGLKAVYTGSPKMLAKRLLRRLGFNDEDFVHIIAWEETEVTPVKWSGSSLPFRFLLQAYGCDPAVSWSIGDNWHADLRPALNIGMRAAKIGTATDAKIPHYANIPAFAHYIWQCTAYGTPQPS